MFDTYFPKSNEVEQEWFEVDVQGKVLGRVASEVAQILQGKHKPEYASHIDVGDYVIVVNVDKIDITGGKEKIKEYFRHTGYLGNEKNISFEQMMKKHPEKVFMHAVKGMLPSNKLSKEMIKKLKVYTGPEHPHQAQKPKPLTKAI